MLKYVLTKDGKIWTLNERYFFYENPDVSEHVNHFDKNDIVKSSDSLEDLK